MARHPHRQQQALRLGQRRCGTVDATRYSAVPGGAAAASGERYDFDKSIREPGSALRRLRAPATFARRARGTHVACPAWAERSCCERAHAWSVATSHLHGKRVRAVACVTSEI